MRATILIVDDEEDILDLLVRTLEGAGYTVDSAANGRLALQKIAAAATEAKPWSYDLILTNVRMPVMNGEALYRAICAGYPRLAHRIVFCTGDTANVDTQCFLNLTGAPVIFKPFHLSTVLQVVHWKLQKETSPVQAPPAPVFRPEAVLFPAF